MTGNKFTLAGAAAAMGLVESDIPAAIRQPEPLPIIPPQNAVYQAGPAPSASALEPADVEQMKAIEAEVYNTPSSYTVFNNVRQALGPAADVAAVFKLLPAGIIRRSAPAGVDRRAASVLQPFPPHG